MRYCSANILGLSMLLTLAVIAPVICSGQYFSAEVYKDLKGMTSNRITDINQRYNREIWIGTQDGLSSYDGQTWQSSLPGLEQPQFTGNLRLNELKDSSLYVTSVHTSSLKIHKLTKGKWTAVNTPFEGMNIPDFHTVKTGTSISGRSSHFIMGYLNTLFILVNDEWTTLVMNSHPSIKIRNIKETGDSLFIVTNIGLHLYSNGVMKTLLENSAIQNLTYNPQKMTLYLAGEDWVGSYKDSQLTYLIENKPVGLYGDGQRSTMMYHDNKIYYSFNSPLHQYDLDTKETKQLISQYYDTDYTCMAAIFDHEGSLWIATLRGTFRIRNLNIQNYNSNELVENEVSAALQTKNGDLYLGSNLGLTVLRNNGNIEKYSFPKKYLQPRVMDIIEYRGKVYMAANSAGVVMFDQKKLYFDPFLGRDTRTLDLEVHDGQLYVLNKSTLYRRNSPGDWSSIYSNTQFAIGIIRKVIFQENNIVLLTDNGVIDTKKNKLIRSSDNRSNNIYTAINYQDKLLLGTTGGIRVLEDDSIKEIYTLTKPVYAMAEDEDGYLWAGTGQGIHFLGDTLFTISKSNGLSGNEVNRNAFSIVNSGKLLVGTEEGVSILNTRMKKKTPVPKIELLEILANTHPIRSGSNLKHDQNNLRFNFRAVSFLNSKELNFRVRLAGQSEDWQYLNHSNQNSILFTNLESGDYQFSVQARIGKGPWSRMAQSQVITIRKAFYQTYWFRIGIGLSIITILVFYFTLRSKSLSQRNEELQRRVDEKTHELKQQNNELLKAIKELKSAQGQLIQSEKLASMGHLTSGIAHELNNPLNYIRGGAECIIRNMHDLSAIKESLDHATSARQQIDDFESIMEDSMRLAESILEGASKSTEIVKSLGSFTADSQNFYSFTDLQKAVDTSLTLLSSEIGFRIIVNRMFGNIPPIECYPAKVNQLLVGILLNAIQSISERGEITIRYYRKGDQNVAIEISDDGVGIPEELKEKVFEPFFTTKDSNPGLGLTIAKSIVQEHHGSIEIRSTVGKGTKVIIMLPVSQTFHPELEGF